MKIEVIPPTLPVKLKTEPKIIITYPTPPEIPEDIENKEPHKGKFVDFYV